MPIVATFASSLTANTSPRVVQVTSQPGDLIIVSGGGENSGVTLNTPSGNGITFTLQQSIVVSNWGTSYVWVGTDNTGGTGWSLSVSSPGTALWGYTVMVARSMTIGTSVKNNGSGTATIDITTSATDSNIVVFNTDWNAVDGSSRTWATVNGTTPTAANLLEVGYGYSNGAYTIYSAYYPATGTAGTKTVGITSPGSQKFAIIALEMVPAAAPAAPVAVAWLSQPTTPTLRAAAINSAATTTSLGVTIPSTTQPGDVLLLTVAQASNSATLFNAIAGWTKQGEQRAGGAAFTLGVFTRVAQAGDAGTTVTSTSVNAENYTGQVRVYYGASQADSMDVPVVFAQQDPAATTAAAPAISPITANTAIVTAFGIPTTTGVVLTDASWTAPTGFGNEVSSSTNTAANNAALVVYDQQNMGTGSQGPFSATVTDNRRWAMASIAVRPDVAPLLYDTFSVAGYYNPQWSTQPGTISGGVLNVTTKAAYSDTLISAQTFDFTGRKLTLQVPLVPTAGSGEAIMELKVDDNNGVSIGWGGGSMVLRISSGGTLDDQYVPYDSVNHLWWRLKLTGTLLEWQTSPDNATWTTLRSATSGYPSLTSVVVEFYAGHYLSGDPDELVQVDNIRLA